MDFIKALLKMLPLKGVKSVWNEAISLHEMTNVKENTSSISSSVITHCDHLA